MLNLITDVAGLKIGNAHDETLLSGVTAVIFDEPAVASIAIHGGAPGVRDTALLEPDMTVERIDALVLSGGSAFGLDAPGGVQAALRAQGRGFAVGSVKIPIVPGAILFDLLNGGDKNWPRMPPYWELGHAAAQAAARDFAIGSAGAGFGATTANLRGGLGSASCRTAGGFTVGALVAANAIGSATIGSGPHFWAAPYEQNEEFGGLGLPQRIEPADLDLVIKGAAAPAPENTTIAIVATDALLTKGSARRLAVMAHDGMGRALRPSHAAMDGDLIFAAATGRAPKVPDARDHIEIGQAAADCLARAIARAIFAAAPSPKIPGVKPSWRERFVNRDVSHTN
ncbi:MULTISPECIES: P1 family peptidase [unclassified Beijerinckia]|uniref:P1 family peptidase n=1 Tax=unclassified Beijerinckia TaxID=2638183 RepID=UPI000894D38E|nr:MULTISPECIES: P1 family peptidase [unclassified Beijerinckia]MDH7799817.1 L-aminopeptidase/D-esterase-like protein [Beijerinckia sp. GAS462]SED38544.1 D-aminopeptidase [Beijerinckia sp. 28-YEA-48]